MNRKKYLLFILYLLRLGGIQGGCCRTIVRCLILSSHTQKPKKNLSTEKKGCFPILKKMMTSCLAARSSLIQGNTSTPFWRRVGILQTGSHYELWKQNATSTTSCISTSLQRWSQTAWVNSVVDALPPRSTVLYFPSAIVFMTAFWIWSALS